MMQTSEKEQQPVRLLLIEDNPGDAGIAFERLSDTPEHDFDLTHVTTLRRAEDALRDTAFDVAVLDLNLPDSTGISTLRRLRAIRKDVALVVLSGDDSDETRRSAYREGAQDFIGKNDYLSRLLSRSVLYALERHRAQHYEQQVRDLASLMPDAVIVTTTDGSVQFANDAAAEFFGLDKSELLKQPLVFAVGEGRIAEIEVQRGAEWRHGEASAVPVHWQGHQAYLASIRDTTAHRKLAEQMEQSQKMEAIGRLAGGIAHDFNNLLVVILGYGELLRRKLDGSAEAHLLDEMIRSGERAASLTRQLLAFSRRQIIQPRVLDMNDAVRNMESLLRRLIGEEIALRMELAPYPTRVKADPVQMEQTIMNLAVNARDAMPRGGLLSFQTAVVRLDEAYAEKHSGVVPGFYVLLAVSDSGHGMDRETVARVFEPFFTTKETGKGTGLGLSTVYGIVRQSGGHIWVYSEPGIGTTFKVYLPECPEEGGTAEYCEIGAAPRHDARETVLIVEDDESVRRFSTTMLEGAGYVVLHASNGTEALEVSRAYAGTLDLLITDMVMPQMDGRALARKIRDQRPDIKVLLVSGYAHDIGERGGSRGPEFAFLSKPFAIDVFLRKVREVLSAPAK